MQVIYLETPKPTPKLKNPHEIELSRQHLLAELTRLDLLLQRQIQRWQSAGQDPTDAFRGLYVSDQEADALMQRPITTHWGHLANGHASDPFALASEEAALKEATTQSRAFANAARSQGTPTRLTRLIETFNLQPFDLDTLLICLAPHLDLRYERIYGYLQDDVTKKLPAVNLVLDLLAPPGPVRLETLTHFSNHAPLFRHHLLEPLSSETRTPVLSQPLIIDRTVAAWLLGEYQPALQPTLHLTLHPAQALPGDELIANLELDLKKLLEKKPLLTLFGPDETAQHAAARLIAAEAKRPLLLAGYTHDPNGELSPLAALELALRDAQMIGAIPFLLGWGNTIEDGSLSPAVFNALCGYPDLVLFATPVAWHPRGYERERLLHGLEFPIPPYAQRFALWQHFLGEAASRLELETVSGQFQLTTGQIRDAVSTALNTARSATFQAPSEAAPAPTTPRPLTTADILIAARTQSNPRLNALARKIAPHYRWEDIILPADQLSLLKELVATVRGRPLVLDTWGVGLKLVPSRGVTVLFAGPPGTGKTMSAEIIAAELGLDLFKIDLSTIVSKYIGETEKNLERIFSEAETSNAILFFDEADALFGKRSEVKDSHDRYANIEISYLLQRMEAYDGVTILATNLRANLDEAFTRRLQFAVDFPFPEQADRLRIWQTLFPPDVPRDSDLDFELLAKRFKLAGGNIRNAIVSAAYHAAARGGVVKMEHLLHGTRRELQKMGRLVAEEEFGKL